MEAKVRKNKKQLRARLKEILRDLTVRYLTPTRRRESECIFPSLEELNQLRSAVTNLYEEERHFLTPDGHRKKFANQHNAWGIFLQVEGRNRTLRITNFCRKLLKKLDEDLPRGPITKISHKINDPKLLSEDADRLRKIIAYCDNGPMPGLDELPWSEYVDTLAPFVSQRLQKLKNPLETIPFFQRADKKEDFKSFLGLASFADVFQQERSWNKTYDPEGRAEDCRGWIHVLNSDELEPLLRSISRVDPEIRTVKVYREQLEKAKARDRKRIERERKPKKFCKKA